MKRLHFIVLALLSSVLSAHPHNWIDVKTQMRINAAGELTAIEQKWTFDPYYSALTLADLQNEYGPDINSGLQIYAGVIAGNLKDYGYFSNLVLDNSAVNLPLPAGQRIDISEVDAEQILHLTMQFEFESPINLSGVKMDWSVYDPTYYIAMRHLTEDDFELLQAGGSDCNIAMVNANPTSEQIAYAQSLDINQRDTDGLGKLFSQHVIVECN